MTMKHVLIASNYDDEMFTETFLNVPPVEPVLGQDICNTLNSICPDGANYYKLVDLDYIPRAFEP